MINPSLQRQFADEILGGEGGFPFSGVARNRRSGIDIGAVEATQRERFRNALGRPEFLGRQRCSEGRITVEGRAVERSEEHTSELQSLMRSSYAGFCSKNPTTNSQNHSHHRKIQSW